MLTRGPISPGVHGILDYPLGVTLVAAPFVLGFDSDTATTVLHRRRKHRRIGDRRIGVTMATAWSGGIINSSRPPSAA